MEKSRIDVQDLLERLNDAILEIVTDTVEKEGGTIAPAVDSKRRRSRRHAEPEYTAIAEQMYFERRKRDEIFNFPGLFGEPAWDILLDLLIAKGRGQKLSVTGVTLGAAAAPTTALRYLGVLENFGLIERIADENDARRYWMSLSDYGFRLMTDHVERVSGLGCERPKIEVNSTNRAFLFRD